MLIQTDRESIKEILSNNHITTAGRTVCLFRQTNTASKTAFLFRQTDTARSRVCLFRQAETARRTVCLLIQTDTVGRTVCYSDIQRQLERQFSKCRLRQQKGQGLRDFQKDSLYSQSDRKT